MTGIVMQLRAWLALSRPPFHLVGVLPFILGTILAWRQEGIFCWQIFAWGVLGVIFIMLATYYAGEYWDYTEDALSARLGASRFAGGSQILQRGLLSRNTALWASLCALLLAIIVGLILQFVYMTGVFTIPFGVIGIFSGFFYSAHPFRWVSRGFGELLIGFCYGWLSVAVGYYLQIGEVSALVNWIAVPIGLTIFNVILLNEFLDYSADLKVGKANLVVRLGRKRASRVYGIASLCSWIAFSLSLSQGVPMPALWFYLPVMFLSVMLSVFVMDGRWQNRASLDKLCAASLLVNLGSTVAFIFAFAS